MPEEDVSNEEPRPEADDSLPSYAPRTGRFILILGLCIAFLVGGVTIARVVFARRPPGAWEKDVWPSGAAAANAGRVIEATPETFAEAVSQVQPGETIMLSPGEYPPTAPISLSGRPGAPITIKAEGRAVFQPRVSIRHSNWLILDGLTIDGTALLETGGSGHYMGLSISNSGYCVVRNLTIRNVPGRYGIYGNNLHHTVFEDNDISLTKTGHGLCVFGASSDIIIRRNYVHDNASCGIYLDAYTRPGSALRGVLAEGNIVARNGTTGGAAFNCSNVVESCFRNNLVYKNLAGGICFFRSADDPAMMLPQRLPASGPRAVFTRLLHRLLNRPSPDCANNTVVGNTVYFEPGQGRWSFKLRDESTGFTVHNNIFFGGKFGTVSVARESFTGLVMDHNFITTHVGQPLLGETFQDDSEPSFEYTVEEWRDMGYDLHGIFNRNPVFKAVEDDRFSLKADSPAIDAGKRLGRWLPRDLEGRQRPKGPAPDCGAFEFPEP